MLYRSCVFDSILELKFALSIENDFHFLRAHIPIYYDPKNYEPTNYITERTKKYTPDFLIRDKINNTAYLVEIKPRGVDCILQLQSRTKIAERFIEKNKYDWKFIILYDDEILLSREQLKKLNILLQHKNRFEQTLHFMEQDKKYSNGLSTYSSSIPSHEGFLRKEYIRFLFNGNTGDSTA